MKKSILSVIVLVIAICSAMAVYVYVYVPSNITVPAFDKSILNLVIEGDIIKTAVQPEYSDNEILLPFEVVKKYLDPAIYWDAALKKVTITTKDKVIRMKTDSLNALVNNKAITLKIPVIEKNRTVYIPIEFVSDYYKIDIFFLKENNVIVIDFRNSIRREGEPIQADAAVRKDRSIHSPAIIRYNLQKDLSDIKLRIFDEYDKWYKVRAAD
jgi:hypothetical protein